jgi:hypothetical protein
VNPRCRWRRVQRPGALTAVRSRPFPAALAPSRRHEQIGPKVSRILCLAGWPVPKAIARCLLPSRIADPAEVAFLCRRARHRDWSEADPTGLMQPPQACSSPIASSRTKPTDKTIPTAHSIKLKR